MTADRLSEGTRAEKERAKLTHQKQGYSRAQDEACNHVGAVVPVLGDPIEACQEGGAEGPEAQHGFSQPTALCLDCACDVHLERTETSEREAACLHAANTRMRTHAPGHANGSCQSGHGAWLNNSTKSLRKETG